MSTPVKTDLHPSIIRLCENYAKYVREADQAARGWDASALHTAGLKRAYAWNALVCAAGNSGDATDYWNEYLADFSPNLYA